MTSKKAPEGNGAESLPENGAALAPDESAERERLARLANDPLAVYLRGQLAKAALREAEVLRQPASAGK